MIITECFLVKKFHLKTFLLAKAKRSGDLRGHLWSQRASGHHMIRAMGVDTHSKAELVLPPHHPAERAYGKKDSPPLSFPTSNRFRKCLERADNRIFIGFHSL